MVSAEWRALGSEDRKVWEKLADEDKARYMKEKAKYSGPWKVPANLRKLKDPTSPKKPVPAYFAFSNARRQKVKSENPSASNAEISKILSQMWKSAPEDVREVYLEEEKRQRKAYTLGMQEWRLQQKEKESIMVMQKGVAEDGAGTASEDAAVTQKPTDVTTGVNNVVVALDSEGDKSNSTGKQLRGSSSPRQLDASSGAAHQLQSLMHSASSRMPASGDRMVVGGDSSVLLGGSLRSGTDMSTLSSLELQRQAAASGLLGRAAPFGVPVASPGSQFTTPAMAASSFLIGDNSNVLGTMDPLVASAFLRESTAARMQLLQSQEAERMRLIQSQLLNPGSALAAAHSEYLGDLGRNLEGYGGIDALSALQLDAQIRGGQFGRTDQALEFLLHRGAPSVSMTGGLPALATQHSQIQSGLLAPSLSGVSVEEDLLLARLRLLQNQGAVSEGRQIRDERKNERSDDS